jgi:hypothetical protein
MQLLHHFVTATVKDKFLSGHDSKVVEVWTVHAPRLAFEHSYLLNAIISVAALHSAKLNPQNPAMAEVYRRYFNIAVREHRAIIASLGPANTDAVCLSASLISLLTFMLRQNIEFGNYSPPLHYFYLSAGHRLVFIESARWRTEIIDVIITATPNMSNFSDEVFKEKYGLPFSDFSSWRAIDEMVDPESQSAYEMALRFVGYVLTSIERGDDPSEIRRVLLSFGQFAPPVYVKRLEENSPRALVILAYFFALAKAVDDVWWMRGIVEREVFGIQSILPEQWQWAMARPLEKLALYAAAATPPMPN